MLYYIDENHGFYKDLAEKITNIVYTKEFSSLQFELELLYNKQDFDRPQMQAFQDALYSFLAQDEGLKPAKAY
ncbi:MAG: hypothetical protein PWQ67_1713 [Clostridia bacterium]|jgi:hypothetical protein|nr:hypothetical protein [Clostridia bacterium]MDN5323259.1 hypothetical protein [Clostridia bacterium]